MPLVCSDDQAIAATHYRASLSPTRAASAGDAAEQKVHFAQAYRLGHALWLCKTLTIAADAILRWCTNRAGPFSQSRVICARPAAQRQTRLFQSLT